MLDVLSRLSDADRLRSLVRQGESKTLEFKQTLSLDVAKQTKESYIEQSALKTLVGFLNSEGGTLLIGVTDDEQILGLDLEIKKLHRGSRDNLLKHLKNKVKSAIGEAFYPLLDYQLVDVVKSPVLMIRCQPADKPCFLDAVEFYVRTNPATDKIDGLVQHEYIERRFGRK